MEDCAATSPAPKSRRKNCASCVQAKRRCGRQTPVCSRCAEKKIDCIYASRPDTEEDCGPSFPPSVDANPAVSSSPFAAGPGGIRGLSPDVNHHGVASINHQVGGATTGSMPNFMRVAEDDLIDGHMSLDPFPFIDFMGNNSIVTHPPNQWSVQADQRQGLMIDRRPGSPANEEVIRAYEKMADFCDNWEPWHLYDPTTPLYYVVNRVKGFIADVATRGAAPFLHRHLYRDLTPPCIISCFSANVLYANRTPANTAMVLRALHRSVRELVDGEAGRVGVTTPLEKLARTQSLFLYQIIRLLDGDVILRAQGERDMPLLHTWLDDLCRVRENLGNCANHGSHLARQGDAVARTPQAPGDWEGWIFAESVRRTIIIAHSFITLYEMMKDPEQDDDDQSPWPFVHRWTLSRHLWEADSSFTFARMWKERPQFIIMNYSFDHFLQYGRGDDVDDFAEILLSMYMGVEEAKEFIAARSPNR